MTALIAVVLGLFAELLKLLFELLQVLIGEIFEIDKFIARAPDGADELIQLQLHGLGVAVLCVLNKKHHQEGNDRGGCVDDKLPGIGKMERWPSKYPDQNHQHSPDKSPRAAEHHRGAVGENTKRTANYAKETVFFFVLF